MSDTQPFLRQTAQTASFALREYFRPLVVASRFLKSWLVPAEPAESAESASRRFGKEEREQTPKETKEK